MAKHKTTTIHFPLGGLNRQGAHRQQAPYTSQDMLNVRAVGSIQSRERGGSRPGLVQTHLTDLGGEVRLLDTMTLSLGDGFTVWSDTFAGTSMAAAWTQATWSSDVPSILPTALASVDYSTAEGDVVLDLLPIDTSEDYAVEVFIVPWDGEWYGIFSLYLRMDDTTPDWETDGVRVWIGMAEGYETWSGKIQSYSSGVLTEYAMSGTQPATQSPSWLTVLVQGNTLKVYWRNELVKTQAVAAHTGRRVGFGMKCNIEGGVCLANTFRTQYYTTGSTDALRTTLIASADGGLFRETFLGTMAAVTTSLTLRDDVPIMSTQSGQKLYIADYGDLAVTGTDGTAAGTSLDATGVADWTALGIDTDDMVCVISNALGTAVAGTYAISSVAAGNIVLASDAGAGACSYRIERAPKIYDPILGTLVIMAATTGDGQVPTGCPLICRYLDRIVMAGEATASHVWYMSRQGDPLDWDYSQTDSQRAVAGTSSDAGVPGDSITALVPHSDDYLIMACRNSLWRMRGDPAYGGVLDSLSHTVGVIGPKAWCLGPAGEMVFLSLDGLYALPPGGSSYPISLSREVLPAEFLNMDPAAMAVSLEYDIQGRGVHIFLTPDSSNARTHWWFDWDRKTFWPVSLASDHEPTVTCAVQAVAIEDSGVLLGCRDGKLRRFSELAANDCGTAFSSYVVCGPIPLAKDGLTGAVLSMEAVLADGSGDVTWSLHPSLSFEGANSASSQDTGTWTEGLNHANRPACRGQAATLKLTGTAHRKWALEDITATVRDTGKRRQQ